MTKPLILVTGATGKTGAPTVRLLRERGIPVRALVRRRDPRAAALAALGAEVVEGDLHDLAALRRAMAGVARVYFVYPAQGGRLLEAATNVAVAARAAGVEALVNLSQIIAREDAPSPLSVQHWQSEQVFDWAGVGAVHIRPTFFAEDLFLFAGPGIAAAGELSLPFGQDWHAPIAAEDIARAVAAILADPGPHAGRRLVLTGPESMSLAEMAEILSAELGRQIDYVEPSIEDWGRALAEQIGFPLVLVRHLTAAAQDHQDGLFDRVTGAVERITGRPPQTLETFVRAHRGAFSGDGASARTANPATFIQEIRQ